MSPDRTCYIIPSQEILADRRWPLSPRLTELFVNAPHESISYIWQVFGCRHTLEPTENDFEPPSIPALTLKGFVRWESIQILLAPDEHVPFITHAVKNWHLKNPDTGEPFPDDIPVTAFPSVPDPEISVWYEACGNKLKKEAAPTPKESPSRPPFPSAADRVHAGFSHVHAGFSHVPAGSRPAPSDYFTHHSVPVARHVSPGHAGRYRGAGLRVSPDRMRFSGMSPQEERARRRSFSDYPSPHEQYASPHLHPVRPTAARRHSHPRRGSTEEDESEVDDVASPPIDRRGSAGHGPTHRSPRFVHIAVPATGTPDGTPPIPSASPPVSIHGIGGAKLRPDDGSSAGRRKTTAEEAKEWAKGKLSGIFAASSPAERPRKSPGSSSGNVAMSGAGGSRDSLPARQSRSRSYDDGESESDSEYERERQRRKRARERAHRDRDAAAAAAAAYERDREHLRRSREWEDDVTARPRSSRKDKDKDRGKKDARYPPRPDYTRRASSHADVDKIDRGRHRYDDLRGERERGRYAPDESRRRRGTGGGGPLDDKARDRTASPVIKGVGGRRYPSETPWAGPQEGSPL